MGEVPGPPRRTLTAVRNEVIERLKLNYAHGNLDEEELEARLSEATAAETNGELRLLIEDLPDIQEGAAATPALSSTGVRLNQGPVREAATLVAVMSGTVRKGLWRPPRSMRAVAFMGSVDLDFTQAEMPPGITEITAFTLMGGVNIKVPPGLNVEMSGFPFMGGFEDHTEGMIDPSAPTLRVRGVAVMGGVEVRVPRRLRRQAARSLRRSDEDE
jgi:DUF1707 SHOCT-like domain